VTMRAPGQEDEATVEIAQGKEFEPAPEPNAPDLGVAFLPQYQDATLAASTTPGANALSTDLLRPLRGFGAIQFNLPQFHETYHSIQSSFNRRFRNGVAFGINYTLSMADTGNVGLLFRLQHAADGTYTIRADQKDYEKLNDNVGKRPHIIKANFLWDLPNMTGNDMAMKAVAALVNGWQVSGVFTAGSTGPYDATFQYQNGGSSVNLTGSPSYPAMIRMNGDPGSGCSSNQYGQFDRTVFSGPLTNSLGMESGRNLLSGCADHTLDLAIARNISMGGGRQVQLRVDMFNALNTVVYSNRQSQLQLNSPTDQTVRNPQYLADGTVDPTRLKPQNAGFGAVTSAQGMRSLQLQLRFQF